jgi:hypothetical protein
VGLKNFRNQVQTKMKKTMLCLISVVVIAAAQVAGQASLSPAQIQQQLLAQPPQAITYQFQKAAAHGLSVPIEVKQYVEADFDGTGAFNYIVALYGLSDQDGGYLRAFKLQGNTLVLAGDEEDHRGVGGYGAALTLIDLKGDGTPTIMVAGHSGASPVEEFFNLYAWTGSSLHNMLPNLTSYGNLVDVDGDGVLEIVYPPLCGSDGCSSGYDVYKLVGNTYKFSKTVAQDPTGLTGSNGQANYVRAFCAKLSPRHFSVGELSEGKKNGPGGQEDHGDGLVHLRFGGLQQVNGTTIDVGQVDTSTIVIAPHLLPVHVSVHRGDDRGDGDDEKDQNDTCRKMDNGRILVDVARSQFLNGLQKLHLNGPLSAGDEVEVKLTAKLRDGSPVGAVFKVSIVGNGQDGGHDH